MRLLITMTIVVAGLLGGLFQLTTHAPVRVEVAGAERDEALAAAPAGTRSAAVAAPRAPSLPTERTAASPRTIEPPVGAPSKQDVAESLIARVRASAPSSEPWTASARGVLDGWRASAGPLAAKVALGALACHREGCIATATYADGLTFEQADEALTTSEAFLAYPGWRHRAYHSEPSGKVVATWVFMRPE